MILPMIRCFLAKGHGDGHLSHHRCPTASDQASVYEDDRYSFARGFERCLDTGTPCANHQDVGFKMHCGCSQSFLNTWL